MTQPFIVRSAQASDVAQLFSLECACFEYDRLSKRRFAHWVSATNAIFLVAQDSDTLLGYALVILRKGSRSARLYSIAIAQAARGKGVGQQLLLTCEAQAVAMGSLFMRLEVAVDNEHAIALYNRIGYRQFGLYKAYYENKTDALRMQKAIKQRQSQAGLSYYPWYQQTTEFTCGCASLMMAGASLDAAITLNQQTELDIWRVATSIYMTSGHGGSHPIGLALAAKRYGMTAKVYLNTKQTPFIDGVRSQHKKALLEVVHKQFCAKAKSEGINIRYQELDINALKSALNDGWAIICLISTYQFDDKKIPHWVAITHIDDQCLYIHDPDIEHADNPIDFQHIPIAIDDFATMATYGKQKLQTCVMLHLEQLK
ncbi:peptidase C39 family protein [Glaciecola sp. XM2]|jgi:ribosomal protein S18 acetylase RimI-like enzyme|uniref:GNAT family N-acetyltransferase/peptidase C39 family protein n=1 Tax=Glaciecola sp. XM2 TaxID=1914931 RepID=UPI001BDDEDB7|nr:GNAT family N-acetyltransferase/peptidase C39 family protein [Glaciecola sp. XM2]MBT1449764.1 peptidase C39 family protein [Glaciecola sp. XM2]